MMYPKYIQKAKKIRIVEKKLKVIKMKTGIKYQY